MWHLEYPQVLCYTPTVALLMSGLRELTMDRRCKSSHCTVCFVPLALMSEERDMGGEGSVDESIFYTVVTAETIIVILQIKQTNVHSTAG